MIFKELKKNIEETVSVIRRSTDFSPEIGIILGTGLGQIAYQIENPISFDYDSLPHFPLSTVEFHKGRLILGTLNNRKIVAMQGRMHYYEGYSMLDITYPIRVMKFLGIKQLIISNASGTFNPDIRKGDIVILEDHINLLGHNPLIGYNEEIFGPRFVDMSEPYSRRLINLVKNIAKSKKLVLKEVVYAAMTGPSLETRAEYRFLRIIGADIVGMSTVPETIVARQMGLEVLGLSIVTDECYPESLQPIDIDDILKTAAESEPKLSMLIYELLPLI